MGCHTSPGANGMLAQIAVLHADVDAPVFSFTSLLYGFLQASSSAVLLHQDRPPFDLFDLPDGKLSH